MAVTMPAVSDMPAMDVPAMTVVMITPDRYDTIRRTMRCVIAQTAREQLELLILAPSVASLHADEDDLGKFRWSRVIEVGHATTSGALRALAARAAKAPVIVYTEDHCFPDPRWAEALIAAHRGPWAAVGPVVRNANPETMVSWADLLIGYGPWLVPGRAGTMTHLPGHNCSYKRAALLDYGAELDAMMDAETVLQWDLRRRGHQLYLEPSAGVAHTNFAFWSLWIPVQFHQGRIFAAVRAAEWSPARKLAFSAASPLIPLVRFWRTLRDARLSGMDSGLLVRCLPTVLAGLAIDGIGQMLGYALGEGKSRDAITAFHFHRNERPTA